MCPMDRSVCLCLLVFVPIAFTNCESLWFTGLDPARIAISRLKEGSGANYVYKYEEGERLNISCKTDDSYEVKDFQLFNSSSNTVIQLKWNTTFEGIANFALDGSSLLCSGEKNGSEYSILLLLDSNRPVKLYFTGLNANQLTVRPLKNGDHYVYKYSTDEYLSIGCESESHVEMKRFLFYNSSTYRHLFHTQLQAIGDAAIHGSGLLCSYENQKQGTHYSITLKLLRRPNPRSRDPHGKPLEEELGKPFYNEKHKIMVEVFGCIAGLTLIIPPILQIQNSDVKITDITTYLLVLRQSAWKIIAFPFAQLSKLTRRKRTDATTVLFTEWAKVVRVETTEKDTSIVPNIIIDKVRYTEFSGMNISSPSEYILPIDNKWELPRENLLFGEVLGEGEFGRVLKADYIGSKDSRMPSTVAVKMLKEEHTDSDMVALVSEMEIMKIMGKHENVVNLLGCCTQGGPLCVVVEYASNGCLREYLKRNDPKIKRSSTEGVSKLMEPDLVDFALQVAKGMEFLVSRGCIHRDLAARNVLVSSARALKIADFGLARDVRDSAYYRKRSAGKLPVRWMAPESLQHSYYTEHSDVWSFGVLFWEILMFGCTPYRQLSVHFLYEYLKSGQRLEKPDGCREITYALMLRCWTFNPEDRPRFSELVVNLQELLNGLEKITIDTNM